MKNNVKTIIKAFLIVLLLQIALASEAMAQDECPQPRVIVANDMDYFDSKKRSEIEHHKLALNTAVGNRIIAQNARDIRFFSAFTAAVPIGDMDYFLSVGSEPKSRAVLVAIKMVDNNQRLVLNFQSLVNDSLWAENTNDIANLISNKLSPLIHKIKDHQHLIRNTSTAAIYSKFDLEKRSYVLKVNEKKRINFVLKDCDDFILSGRRVILELDGGGKIDRTTCTLDENGLGEFTYTASEDNEQATVTLIHEYEDVAGNDNQVSLDAIKFNSTGKLWLLVNHISKTAEIYIVGEHIGELEMIWNDENTRGGSFACFSDGDDDETWSSYSVDFIEMTITPAGDNVWTAFDTWFPGPTKIKAIKGGAYEIEILWPIEDGTSMPVRGTISSEKPELFNQARRKYLTAKRGR